MTSCRPQEIAGVKLRAPLLCLRRVFSPKVCLSSTRDPAQAARIRVQGTQVHATACQSPSKDALGATE